MVVTGYKEMKPQMNADLFLRFLKSITIQLLPDILRESIPAHQLLMNTNTMRQIFVYLRSFAVIFFNTEQPVDLFG